MIHLQFGRVAHQATAVESAPQAGRDPAAPRIQRYRDKAASLEDLVARVHAVAVGIAPAGEPLATAVGGVGKCCGARGSKGGDAPGQRCLRCLCGLCLRAQVGKGGRKGGGKGAARKARTAGAAPAGALRARRAASKGKESGAWVVLCGGEDKARRRGTIALDRGAGGRECTGPHHLGGPSSANYKLQGPERIPPAEARSAAGREARQGAESPRHPGRTAGAGQTGGGVLEIGEGKRALAGEADRPGLAERGFAGFPRDLEHAPAGLYHGEPGRGQALADESGGGGSRTAARGERCPRTALPDPVQETEGCAALLRARRAPLARLGRRPTGCSCPRESTGALQAKARPAPAPPPPRRRGWQLGGQGAGCRARQRRRGPQGRPPPRPPRAGPAHGAQEQRVPRLRLRPRLPPPPPPARAPR